MFDENWSKKAATTWLLQNGELHIIFYHNSLNIAIK